MAYMTIPLLYLSIFAVRINGEVVERDGNVNFSYNPAAVFRYANFPSIVGHQLYTRQEGCSCQEGGKFPADDRSLTGCQEAVLFSVGINHFLEKCCTTDEKATFCVPEVFLITKSLYHSQFSLTNSSLRSVVVEHGAMVSWRRVVVMAHTGVAVQRLVRLPFSPVVRHAGLMRKIGHNVRNWR